MLELPCTEQEWFLARLGLRVLKDDEWVRFTHKDLGVVYECNVDKVPDNWRDNVLGALDLLNTFPP